MYLDLLPCSYLDQLYILINHFVLYEAITWANNNPGPYPMTTAFQFSTPSSSSSSSSSFGCRVGGVKQFCSKGRPHRPTFPLNEDLGCPIICVACGITPLSWLWATLMYAKKERLPSPRGIVPGSWFLDSSLTFSKEIEEYDQWMRCLIS